MLQLSITSKCFFICWEHLLLLNLNKPYKAHWIIWKLHHQKAENRPVSLSSWKVDVVEMHGFYTTAMILYIPHVFNRLDDFKYRWGHKFVSGDANSSLKHVSSSQLSQKIILKGLTELQKKNNNNDRLLQYVLCLIQSNQDIVSGDRRCCQLYLDVMFQCREHHTWNFIHSLYCAGDEAEIPEGHKTCTNKTKATCMSRWQRR